MKNTITRKINIKELSNHVLDKRGHIKIRALAKAITLVENHAEFANDFFQNTAHILNSKTHVIGITGLPGAGKSTLVNLLVKMWRAQNQTVAVLAVDPSALTGGAVLGDRIRMQEHFKDSGVFIRSMGARGALGGLSHATHKTIELLKIAGFDKIIIETVGVGQSESEIIQEADTVVLVLLPNTGDEVQFMKAGVIQLAHIFLINKTDLSDPYRMIQELEDNDAHENGWKSPVLCASAIENRGLNELMIQIENHQKFLEDLRTGSRGQAAG